MAKKQIPPNPPGKRAVRQSAVLQEILDDLQSPEEHTRAQAVRRLCPCRTAWDVPVQRYIAAMREDPSSSVRHEVNHVLDEDSRWGRKLEMQKLKAEMAECPEDPDVPGPHSIGWRTKRKPRTKRWHYPQQRELSLKLLKGQRPRTMK